MTLAEQSETQTAQQSPNRLLIALLMFSLVMPFFFYLGGLRLSMYRVYLLVFAVPVFVRWLAGVGGRIRTSDILVIIASFWMMAALFINHGVNSQLEFAGILVVETIVPYLAARVLIRDLVSFRTFVWWFFTIVMVLLPFAFYENLTGRPILMDFFRGIFKVYYNVNQEPRLGLERAQASMPHPILFGVFCAPAFALSWYVLSPEGKFFKQIRRPLVVGAAVFSSLSSGAFMGVLLQAFLIAWDEILKTIKTRWRIFALIFGLLYIVLELASNRNAFQIIATEFTFSPGTAWNRIHIFNNAIDDIFRNPLFGIGLGYWTRPDWLRASVDNYWLLVALRYGIPAWFLMTLSALVMCWTVGRARLTGLHARARTGYLIAFSSMIISAFTVHLWDATYCMFMFLLGAGAWFTDTDGTQDQGPESDSVKPPGRRKIRYTRFPKQAPDDAPS
ncbi:O-antigen ligase family protein [Roseovarius pacificus]|uniref:O-antigen ligase family protein n=1 Tax=Roseovarius pacificus TaxID=337701 RepID=UPI00403977BD